MERRRESIRSLNLYDPTPVYFKVQTDIRQEIENGRWKPGACVPTEKQLAETYRCSIGTVKKALLNLIHEGYLYRHQGKGTFVAGGTLRSEGLRYYRTQKDFLDQDHDFSIKFLTLKKIDGIEPYNRYLKLRSNQGLYELRRHIIIDAQPRIYTISYLPRELFKDLDEFPRSRFEKMALYLALEKSHGVPNIFNQELIGAVRATEEIAGMLDVEVGAPILFIEMLAYTYKERPYEYRRAYCLTDQIKVFREY